MISRGSIKHSGNTAGMRKGRAITTSMSCDLLYSIIINRQLNSTPQDDSLSFISYPEDLTCMMQLFQTRQSWHALPQSPTVRWTSALG